MALVIFLATFRDSLLKFWGKPEEGKPESNFFFDESVNNSYYLHQEKDVSTNMNNGRSKEIPSNNDQGTQLYEWHGLYSRTLVEKFEDNVKLNYKINGSNTYRIKLYIDFDLTPAVNSNILFKCFEVKLIVEINEVICDIPIELPLPAPMTGREVTIKRVLENKAKEFIKKNTDLLTRKILKCLD